MWFCIVWSLSIKASGAHSASIYRVKSSTLHMVAAGSSEMLVPHPQTKQCHIPEDHKLRSIQNHENAFHKPLRTYGSKITDAEHGFQRSMVTTLYHQPTWHKHIIFFCSSTTFWTIKCKKKNLVQQNKYFILVPVQHVSATYAIIKFVKNTKYT
jgi:hypothetical protein